jgi:hypothetical protein
LGHLYAVDFNQQNRAETYYRQAIAILERTRGLLVDESFRIGYFGQSTDAYDGLIALSLRQGDARTAFSVTERARSRALVEQLAQTKLTAPSNLSAKLLKREENALDELRHLNQLLRNNTSGDGVKGLLNKIESAQGKLGRVLQRISGQAADYAALRRAEPMSFLEIRELLCG